MIILYLDPIIVSNNQRDISNEVFSFAYTHKIAFNFC